MQVRVSLVEGGDLLAGEVGWEALLPDLVAAFDFALCASCGSIAKANAVEMQGPPQLGQCFGDTGEEQAVVIDVNLQWHAEFEEGGRQKVQVGPQCFALIDFGAG